MHRVEIPQSVVERVTARCGTAHPYSDIAPKRSALVVVDLQNAFMLKDVAHALCETAVEIVPNVNRLAAAFRRNGGRVVWVQTAFRQEVLRDWSSYYDLVSPERRDFRARALTPGSRGYDLFEELDVRKEDLRVEKTRYSAFLPGSCDLGARLRELGCDTVAVVGTVTNVCCESSARDAMMSNFRTIMVSDANAASNDGEHNASLVSFYLNFGDVMETQTVIGFLDGKPVERA